MNLHHSGQTPDWETIEPARRSPLQRIAAVSHGIATLPNLVSLVGFAIVIIGLMAVMDQRYLQGAGLILVGRLLDIVDGLVAEATKTKGPVGEFVDACFDKVATILTIIVLFASGVADWWVIALLLVPQILIVIVTGIVRQQGRRLHPSLAGKYSMALSWVGLVGLLLVQVAGTPMLISVISHSVILAAVVLSIIAVKAYLKSEPASGPNGTPRS